MTIASLPDPIADLWREARTWLADAMRDFLGPVEIARTLARKARAAVRRRLVRLEALVLKLVLIEAIKLCSGGPLASSRQTHADPTALAASQTRVAGRKPALLTEDPAAPETWRVRFSLRLPREPKPHQRPRDAGGPRIRDLGRPLFVRDIWREQARAAHIARLHPKPDAAAAHARALTKARKLARRFEAVRRVLADPRRIIAALARKLAALGAGARAFARRIALISPPRGGGLRFANAIVYASDASLELPCDDTS